jgi:hypothetical protein
LAAVDSTFVVVEDQVDVLGSLGRIVTMREKGVEALVLKEATL